jgi:uncharacterized protein YaaW (UPF0174 family)
MLTLISTPVVAILIQKLVVKINKKLLKKVKIHIVAKELCKKTVFELSKKYASVLLIISVCYVFSSGMPLLLFVGFLVMIC